MSHSIRPAQPAGQPRPAGPAGPPVGPPAAGAGGHRAELSRSTPGWSRRLVLASGAAAVGLAALGCGQSEMSGQSPAAAPVDLSLLWVTRPGEETLWGDVYPKLL